MQKSIPKIYSSMMLLIFSVFIFTSLSLDWSVVENLIQEGINQGIFSGCVLQISTHNSTYIKKAYGTVIPKKGFYAPVMQINYKFDINRLTQVIGTNSALMQLYDLGSVNITKRVALVLTDFNNNNKSYITMDNMLQHNSGFPYGYTGVWPATPALLLKSIQGLKLEYVLESKYQYSEIGYTVLGHMVEKLKNCTIKDAIFQVLILAGLRDTGYAPTSPKDQIVPGGYNNGTCRGIPFNKYAKFLNNMSGNSGLFSTVDNVMTYMQLLLNKGKFPGYSRVFSEQVINLFTSVMVQKKYNNTHARGWETGLGGVGGSKSSKDSFGLGDTSGSYVWADNQKNLAIVLLANGNFPVEREVPVEYLGKVTDAIMKVLGF